MANCAALLNVAIVLVRRPFRDKLGIQGAGNLWREIQNKLLVIQWCACKLRFDPRWRGNQLDSGGDIGWRREQ